MDNEFTINLLKYRKASNLTQEQLAKKIGVSFQAVSKWETGLAYPDIELLPALASIFQISIDTLLGYRVQKIKITEYEDHYQSETYYWGNQVWDGCYEVLKKMPPIRPLTLLDIGCGEGQASVFFAKNGYQVSAFDIAQNGIDKGIKLAQINNVSVNFFNANILDYQLGNNFDVVYGSGVLQYIPLEFRDKFFENIQSHTNVGGINIFNVFVEKPFLPTPPDWELTESFWKSGELFRFYKDWQIDFMEEKIFDCHSSDVLHKHCMDTILATKVC